MWNKSRAMMRYASMVPAQGATTTCQVKRATSTTLRLSIPGILFAANPETVLHRSEDITRRLRFRDSTTRMDDILDQARDAVEAPIVRHSLRPPIPLTLRPQDFEGQRLATSVNYVLLCSFGVRRSPRARRSPVARSPG